MASKNRAGPAVMIVVILAALAIAAPVLARYHSNPQALITEIQAMTAKKTAAPSADFRHVVWVNRRSGLYYCRDSRFYGRIYPGESMRQGSALERGFRPAQGRACQ